VLLLIAQSIYRATPATTIRHARWIASAWETAEYPRGWEIGANAMKSSTASMTIMVFLTGILAGSGVRPAAAQTTSHAGDIPQSLRIEHQDTLEQLTALTRRHGPVGVEARKALDLFKRHAQREMEFILPPLTLLPQLADGKATPDMRWAIAMSDRVKAEREQIFQEHTQITDTLNSLAAAALKARDTEAFNFARSAAADSLNDVELLEPISILIGDYLRAKLPTGQ
jgi:hypothetical protein